MFNWREIQEYQLTGAREGCGRAWYRFPIMYHRISPHHKHRTHENSPLPRHSSRIPVWSGNSTTIDVICKIISSTSLSRTMSLHMVGRCLRAKPNAAHHALASLALPSTRARLLPSLSEPDQPPLFVTQNFDSLSPRVLDMLNDELSSQEMKVARERLIEMHGSAFRTTCLQCKHVNFTYDRPLAPALENVSADNCGEKVIPIGELPRCGSQFWNGSNRFGRCGGLLRPGVVWFGEVPDGMGEIAKELNWTDVLIVVGTSSLVRLVILS